MAGGPKIYFIIFGILTIAGGIVGYVKAASTASLIAGSITGILLIIAALLLPTHQLLGLILALFVSLLLAARFVPIFISKGKIMPAGIISILSIIGVVWAIIALVRK